MHMQAAYTTAARPQQLGFFSLSKRFCNAPPTRSASRPSKLLCRAAQAGVPGDPLPGTPNSLSTEKQRIEYLKNSPPGKAAISFVHAYQNALKTHPVAVKACTSLIGFALGDRIAQSFIGGDAAFDIFRCARLSLYGLLIDGPIGHYFYKFLDTKVSPEDPKSAKAVLSKTAIDQLLWAPAMTVVFLAFLTTLEGHPEAIMSVVQAKLGPIYLANLSVWPLFHILNFRFIPPEQRILFNNLVAILWTTYLSYTCGSIGGHSGTPRDALAAGLPCAAQAAAALMVNHHLADALRQTSAVESMLGHWGTDGLPNADAGTELLINYTALKVCLNALFNETRPTTTSR